MYFLLLLLYSYQYLTVLLKVHCHKEHPLLDYQNPVQLVTPLKTLCGYDKTYTR